MRDTDNARKPAIYVCIMDVAHTWFVIVAGCWLADYLAYTVQSCTKTCLTNGLALSATNSTCPNIGDWAQHRDGFAFAISRQDEPLPT